MSHTLNYYLDNPNEVGPPRDQERDKETHAPRIHHSQLKSLSFVCPQVQTAQEIYNISRLVGLSKLSVVVSWNDRTMKLRSVFLPGEEDVAIRSVGSVLGPGQFVLHDGRLLVRCAEGTMLGVNSMVLPFSHLITAEQFYRNYSFQCDKVFHMVWKRENTGCCRVS